MNPLSKIAINPHRCDQLTLVKDESLNYKMFVYMHLEIELSFEEWLEKVGKSAFHPIFNNDILVAVVLVRRNEIHVVIDQDCKGKWYKRLQIQKIFQDIINEYGTVLTCTTYGDNNAKEFVEKLGFKPDNIVFSLDKVPHAKEVSSIKKDFELKLSDLNGTLIHKMYVIEEGLKKYPQITVPEKFMFSKGVCVKEVILPKDSIIISKLHRHSGITIISKGDVSVLSDEKEGWVRMQAPCSFESPAGTKRAIYVHEETTWANTLATDETDIKKLESLWVISSHKQYIEELHTLKIEGK